MAATFVFESVEVECGRVGKDDAVVVGKVVGRED